MLEQEATGTATQVRIKRKDSMMILKKKLLIILKYVTIFIATEGKQTASTPFHPCSHNILLLSFSSLVSSDIHSKQLHS